MASAGSTVRKVGDGLLSRGLTVAVAESCTAGLLGYRLTSVAGSSEWFRGGVVCYANDVKTGLLGVRGAILDAHGAVSRDVAVEMAARVRGLLRAGVGVGITGVAGPGGGTARKPVGLVWIAVDANGYIAARRFLFEGGRAAVRAQAVSAALELLVKAIGRATRHGKETG